MGSYISKQLIIIAIYRKLPVS